MNPLTWVHPSDGHQLGTEDASSARGSGSAPLPVTPSPPEGARLWPVWHLLETEPRAGVCALPWCFCSRGVRDSPASRVARWVLFCVSAPCSVVQTRDAVLTHEPAGERAGVSLLGAGEFGPAQHTPAPECCGHRSPLSGINLRVELWATGGRVFSFGDTLTGSPRWLNHFTFIPAVCESSRVDSWVLGADLGTYVL